MVALKCVSSVIRGKVKFRWQEREGKNRGTLRRMRLIRKGESAGAVLMSSPQSTA